jgi:drug/metabolite transporter (DMT)-like permease
MTQSVPGPEASLIRGFLWMSGAIMSFVAMGIGGRELSNNLSTLQILTFRSLVALLITILVISRVGWHVVKTEYKSLHFFRSIFHFGGQFGWFFGISLLPLSTVFALEYATPVWTAILAFIFLGERMHRARVLAILSGILGVLLILRPGLRIIDPASLIVIGAAFCYAVAYILTKTMIKTEHPLAILFYMNLIQLPIGFGLAVFVWVTPSMLDTQWIILVGVGGFFSHYCLARALQFADTLTVIPIDFMRLPIIATIGYFFYNELFEIVTLLGAVIIFIGTYYNIRYESARNKTI